ncbi:MAG: hypothetical protein JWR38_821 [Mucilaginibacter sp.]|nr:hypothetical protein [Mucilaginibacter sp.]
MIFFWGIRAALTKTVDFAIEKCPYCESTGTTSGRYFSRHFHIFWIPIFPIGKTGYVVCSQCHSKRDTHLMNPGLREAFLQEKKTAPRFRFWQFTGLALPVLFFMVGVVAVTFNEKYAGKYIEDPKSGDTYFCTQNNGYYTTYRVDHISRDSVYSHLNNYEIADREKLSSINRKVNYSKTLLSFSRKELLELYKNRRILKVERW